MSESPAPTPPRQTFSFLNLVLFIVLLGTVAWAGMRYQQQQLASPSPLEARIQALESAQQAASGRMDALEKKLQTTRSDTPASAISVSEDIEVRIAQLEESLKNLSAAPDHLAPPPVATATPPAEQAPPPPPPPPAYEMLSVLESRVAALESIQMADEKLRPRMVATLNAFYQLQTAVILGKPYAAEYAQFAEMVDDKATLNEAMDILNSYADEGVPTQQSLSKELSELAHRALAPNISENAFFTERLRHNLGSLVTIRKVGEHQKGLTLEAVLARAEAHMNQGELEAAVAEIESLTIAQQGLFTDWLSDARMRLSMPATLSEVQQALLQSFSHRE